MDKTDAEQKTIATWNFLNSSKYLNPTEPQFYNNKQKQLTTEEQSAFHASFLRLRAQITKVNKLS